MTFAHHCYIGLQIASISAGQCVMMEISLQYLHYSSFSTLPPEYVTLNVATKLSLFGVPLFHHFVTYLGNNDYIVSSFYSRYLGYYLKLPGFPQMEIY